MNSKERWTYDDTAWLIVVVGLVLLFIGMLLPPGVF
jgi:hypothetical protein